MFCLSKSSDLGRCLDGVGGHLIRSKGPFLILKGLEINRGVASRLSPRRCLAGIFRMVNINILYLLNTLVTICLPYEMKTATLKHGFENSFKKVVSLVFQMCSLVACFRKSSAH